MRGGTLIGAVVVLALTGCGGGDPEADIKDAPEVVSPAASTRGQVINSISMEFGRLVGPVVLSTGSNGGTPDMRRVSDGSRVDWMPDGPDVASIIQAYGGGDLVYVTGQSGGGGLQASAPAVAALSAESGGVVWRRQVDGMLLGANSHMGVYGADGTTYGVKRDGTDAFTSTGEVVEVSDERIVVKRDEGRFGRYEVRDPATGSITTIITPSSEADPEAPTEFSDSGALALPNGDRYEDGNGLKLVRKDGSVAWTVEGQGRIVATSPTRVAVYGPTGDLVILDGGTGATLGEPIKTTGTQIEDCGEDVGGFLNDTTVVLDCEASSIPFVAVVSV